MARIVRSKLARAGLRSAWLFIARDDITRPIDSWSVSAKRYGRLPNVLRSASLRTISSWDVTRRMVLSRLPELDFAVAYPPGNDHLEVDLSKFSAPLSARWFDPVSGCSTPVPGNIPHQGVHRFTPPAKGDWVLVLEGE